MKSIKLILLCIFALIGTMLHAQVVEWHRNDLQYVNKNYFKYIDSLVYVPAQDWSIKINVDSFYVDQEEKVHVVATANIGPDAHVVMAAIGNHIYGDSFDKNSDGTIYLEPGKTVQTIDFEIPNPQEPCNLYVATKNKYNELWGFHVASAKVDYVNWNWTPWTSTKKDWVDAGYDAKNWPLSEDASTCTYTYKNIFSGDDTELPISYRLNLQDPEVAQIKIDNWCVGVSLVLDYNPQTKQISIPLQTSGYIDDSLGEFFITDVSGWQGKDYTASYPCYYDPETGLIVLNSAWVLADMSCYGYGVETIQLDGFYIPDYSVDAEFIGIQTNDEQEAFAQINLRTLGVDAEKAMAMIVSAQDDVAAVADALAAGEVEGTDVALGYNNIAIEEGMTGELQVVICSVLEGSAMDVKSFKFEYYGGGANPWQSIGTGYFTDDIMAPMYNVAPPTYEVEILANEELPGIYRVMNPYSNSVYPYAEDDCAPEGLYLEVNAADPEGVYIQAQSLGFDWGDGEFGFVSEGASYMGDYDFETIKKAGLFGTLQEGVIKFPVFTTKQGVNYQGYVTLDGKPTYYAGMNGKVEITLPTSNAFAQNMAKAKAKVSAMKIQKEKFSGVKVEKKLPIIFNRKVEFTN